MQWVVCLPFQLGIKGAWVDSEAAHHPGFVGRYGPMFANYAGNSTFGYLYGFLLLIHKLAVVWALGSTVKGATAKAAEADTPTLWVLCCVTGLQALFLLLQRPFNDRVENFVQFIVHIQQTLFFALLLQHSQAGTEGSTLDGSLLNGVNVAPAALLIVNSGRSQVLMLYKLLPLSLSTIHPHSHGRRS